jgi:hypothetical protein
VTTMELSEVAKLKSCRVGRPGHPFRVLMLVKHGGARGPDVRGTSPSLPKLGDESQMSRIGWRGAWKASSRRPARDGCF